MSSTIVIQKDDLWKYSTFFLLAIVIIGGVMMFSDSGSGNTNANTGGNGADGNGVAAAGADLLAAIDEHPDLFPSIGPEDASVVVTEFMDFQCPYCGLASGLAPWGTEYATQYSDLYGISLKLEDLAAEGDIRFVIGIMSFLGQESVYAAQAVFCADDQDKALEMHNELYLVQTQSKGTGKYSKANLKVLAQNVDDLDLDAFNTCIDTDASLDRVTRASAVLSEFASGTPTIYVNNQKVSTSWSAVQSAIGG